MEITRIEPFIEYYSRVRERTRRVVDCIPPDRLDWTIQPGRFTLGDLVRHVAAIERYMFAENFQLRPSQYSGCGKELAATHDEILQFLERTHAETLDILSRLTPGQLLGKCTTPGGTNITIWKWLRAMPEHEIHHRGQLYTYLSILNIPTPPLYGLREDQVAAASRKE